MLWIYDNVSSTVNRDTLATDPATAAASATKTIIFTITAPSPAEDGGGMQDQTNNYNKWMFMVSDFYSVRDTAIHYNSQCPHLVPVLGRIGHRMYDAREGNTSCDNRMHRDD